MSSTLEQRIARYTQKVNPARFKELTDSQLDDITYREVDWLQRQSHLRDQVLGVLRGESVISTDYPKYYCYTYAVDAAQRRFGGGSVLVDEVAILGARWKARGCTEAILDKIRNEVFAIPAPAGP